ncbi:MAG: hypothetical protein HQL69_23885 [Magnetococcales bacterium]|nr:hypothetical protein [Magnetococcales bacterium]
MLNVSGWSGLYKTERVSLGWQITKLENGWYGITTWHWFLLAMLFMLEERINQGDVRSQLRCSDVKFILKSMLTKK